MSELLWIVLAVVGLLLVAGIAVAVVVLGKRKKQRQEEQRRRADELRREAETEHAGGLTQAQREAREAEARAELARAEAERAEAERLRAEQGLAQQEARREDALRKADRLDPDVDHEADDYRPGAHVRDTGPAGTPPVAEPETTPHRPTSDASEQSVRPPGSHRRDT
ncbi:hypothetical protein [Nocardioides sp. SYSU DS0663]|uniref:hypothetical protein n=1 Tax=Nocardioides sp. SYSU DS0663 TaxID=3416445 RepID=UPI003F4C3668